MDSTTGHQGGWPPDPVVVVEMPHIGNRPSLPISPDLQPAQKRGLGVGIPLREADDMDVVIMDDGVGGEATPSTILMGSEGRTPAVSSFRDKLMGSNGVLRDLQYISELDVEVGEEDGAT
ncbi:hypothetical protein V6N13_101437 [Hibiscus sabdariffa]